MLLDYVSLLTFKYFIQLTSSFKTPQGPKTSQSFCKNRCLKPNSTSTGKLFEVGFSQREVHLSRWANILETCWVHQTQIHKFSNISVKPGQIHSVLIRAIRKYFSWNLFHLFSILQKHGVFSAYLIYLK